MPEPLVCAVCLTKDRPALLQRAIRCFRAQTYHNKILVICDTSQDSYNYINESKEVRWHPSPAMIGLTIGDLRNGANEWCKPAEILMHWDDDDWSAPTRMGEQVALLQSSGAAAVGYNEMLFWHSHTRRWQGGQYVRGQDDGAWLYRHPRGTYCIGTSLCYWRKTWESKPFPNLHCGEDTEWARDLATEAASSVPSRPPAIPLMVAEIHGRNTTAHVQPGKSEWKRVPEWDDRLREIIAL